jgi:integrase/recombinase XerD
VRVFPVVLPSGERYWTVLDEQLAVVEVADAFCGMCGSAGIRRN